MSRLALSRLPACSHINCDRIATFKDKKCYDHTETSELSYVSDNHIYPTPDKKGITGDAIGVEIECYPFKPNLINGYPHVEYWSHDGSLNSDGREIKVCDKPEKVGRIAAEIMRAIRQDGGIVNRDCGTHVHVSKRSINRTGYYDHMNKVIMFSNRLKNSVWDLFTDRSHEYVSRSGWITNRSRTIEVRIHNGTLNPHIIIAWVDVCRKIQNAINGAVNGQEELFDKWVNSGDFMYPFKKNSYAYRYLKARKDNRGRMSDTEFSF